MASAKKFLALSYENTKFTWNRSRKFNEGMYKEEI